MKLRRSKAEPAQREAQPFQETGIDDGPSLLAMVRIVAITVALIILVSFAAGYGFGRWFL